MIKIYLLWLYLETTVFNYYFDEYPDGHKDVIKLFKFISEKYFDTYISRYVYNELDKAQEPKRSGMKALIDSYDLTVIQSRTDIIRLSDIYLQRGVFTPAHMTDCLHVAAASVYGVDYIVSYNFRHINRPKTQELTAHINIAEGYSPVRICTAREVLELTGHDV